VRWRLGSSTMHVSRARYDSVEAACFPLRRECDARAAVCADESRPRHRLRHCRPGHRARRQHDRRDQSRRGTRAPCVRETGMRKYITVFNLGLQNTFVYRWNYFLRAVFGLIPLAGTVFLWRAVFREPGGGMNGYDYGSMIYYYLLTIVVSNLVTPTEDEWQIASDIREGQINSFLTKPVNYLAYRYSIFLSGQLVFTFVTIPPIALILFYFRDHLSLPSHAL